MDIHRIAQESIEKVLKAEGQRLLDEACRMRPVIVGDLHYTWYGKEYTAYGEFGFTPATDNTIDSTAIVIDDTVKALPPGGEH